MNLLARLLDLHTPDLVKERILDELFAATAAGFGRAAPATTGLPYDERLAAYARFTRDEAEQAIREGRDLVEVQNRLRREAFALGQRLRDIFSVAGPDEALVVARPLYRAIGIDFRGTPAGEVTVSRCFFRDFYTPEICRLISVLDEGVLAGLAGGGQLVFSQRLTEGYGCCRARFIAEEAPP
jgi:hypothetical protein